MRYLIKKLFHSHKTQFFVHLGTQTIHSGTQCTKCGDVLHSWAVRVK